MAEFFDATVKKPMLAHVPAWVRPNHLTVLRAALVVPLVIFKDCPSLAVGLLCLSSAFDILDGPLARARGHADKFGAVLDPICDKIFILGALFFACGDRVHLSILLTIGVLEAALTIIRPIKERLGAPMNSNMIGGAKIWVQSFAIGFVLSTNPVLVTAAPFVFAAAILSATGSLGLHLRDLLLPRVA